jgi:hypothetical protein
VGLASYSFSRLPLEAAIQGIRRVGVNYVSIKDAHLPMVVVQDAKIRFFAPLA